MSTSVWISGNSQSNELSKNLILKQIYRLSPNCICTIAYNQLAVNEIQYLISPNVLMFKYISSVVNKLRDRRSH